MNFNHDYVEKYSYQGKLYTVAELSSMTSIEDFNLRYHLRLNRTVQDTLNRIGKSNSNVFHENKWHTYAELSLLLDIEEEDVAQGAKDLLTVPEIIAIYKDRPKTLTFEYEGKQRTATEIANMTGYPMKGLYKQLRKGKTVEEAIAIFKQNVVTTNIKHGGVNRAQTHGMTNTITFVSWTAMKNRCANPEDKNYGGRGITVCQAWLDSFETFYKDMGPRPGLEYSIERKNNDGNYEPSNCKWATDKEQSLNKRNTVLVVLSDGSRVTVEEAAGILGLNEHTVRSRLNQGYELTLPVTKQIIDEKHLHEGKLYTVQELEVITGIKDHTLRYHLRNGKTIPEIIKITSWRPRRVVYDGSWLSIVELAKATGIAERTLRTRFAAGETLEKITEEVNKNREVKTYPYQGKEMTIRELELATGCKPKVLRKYLSRGHTVEETMKIVAKNVEIMKARNGGIYQSSTASN